MRKAVYLVSHGEALSAGNGLQLTDWGKKQAVRVAKVLHSEITTFIQGNGLPILEVWGEKLSATESASVETAEYILALFNKESTGLVGTWNHRAEVVSKAGMSDAVVIIVVGDRNEVGQLCGDFLPMCGAAASPSPLGPIGYTYFLKLEQDRVTREFKVGTPGARWVPPLLITQDWLGDLKDAWGRIICPEKSRLHKVLEIGSWEGRSASWFLNNICDWDQGDTLQLVCVDHFEGHQTATGLERRNKFNFNLSLVPGGKSMVKVIDQFSVPGMLALMSNCPGLCFDLIYIDGSHRADDTLLDAELAWRMANLGAFIIFDDYEWPTEPDTSILHPKAGIDAFLQLHKQEYEVLQKGYQVIIRKTVACRLGFCFAV